MRTIGMLGGMSWESTQPYYRIVNETIRETMGGLHSAKIVLVSVDFHEIEAFQSAGNWTAAARLLADGAEAVERAGADFLVLCTNTMHKVIGEIEGRVRIPVLHIASATSAAIHQAGLTTVGLLGTRFTMEQDFYRSRLEADGLTVLIPDEQDRYEVHRIIYEELCLGQIEDKSRQQYQRIAGNLIDRGAQGIILGCTEIGLLIGAQDVPVPVFDSAEIHARIAAHYAMASERSIRAASTNPSDDTEPQREI